MNRLQRDWLLPIRAEEQKRGRLPFDLARADHGHGGALRRNQVANFTRELATMLAAGQDLDRALRFVVETARGARIRSMLGEVRIAVRNGSPLSAALARHPRSFSRLYVGLVRAGEAGGTLSETLDHLARLLERERRLAASIGTAMVYPALLVLVASGAIAFLLTWVLPQFVPLFEQAGANLPTATQILIGAGDLVSTHGLQGLCALAMLLVAARQCLRIPRLRLYTDRLMLGAPIVGRLAREVIAARFARTLGTLLLNGVQLVAALGISKDAIGNLAGVAAVEQATIGAKAGTGLWRPLRDSGIFPPETVHLLRLGEETAQLGAMALQAAEIHEEKVRLGLERLVALLIPAITIVMGTAVAAIVASLVLAMLGLNELAQ